MTILLPTNVTMLGQGIDPDAARWIATVGPASVSGARGRLISDTIRSLKAGVNPWRDIDYLLVMTAENTASALVDWKSRKTATEVAAPTFTADRGYAFNGTTQYLASNFTPSTDCAAATGTSFSGGAYERTDLAATTANIGAANSGTQGFRLIPRNVSLVTQAILNAATVTLAAAVTDSRGLTMASTNGTTGGGYKNGVGLDTPVLVTPGTALTSRSLYIGAHNSNGTAANFRASTLGYAVFGANLTAAQQLAFYNTMQTLMVTLGANV